MKKYRLWKIYLQTKDAKVCGVLSVQEVRRLTRQAVKSKEKNIANQVKSNSKQHKHENEAPTNDP